MKSRTKIGVISVFAALAVSAPAALCQKASFPNAANSTIGLSPVTVESSVNYSYFDMPTAVQSDNNGIYVTDKSNLTTIVDDTFSITPLLADKAYKYVGGIVSLYRGDISLDGGVSTISLGYSASDFCIYSHTLYVTGEDKLSVITLNDNAPSVEAQYTVTLSSISYSDITAKSVTSYAGDVYLGIKSAYAPKKDDIIRLAKNEQTSLFDGSFSTLLYQSNEIMSLASNKDYIYTLTRDEIASYITTSGALKKQNSAHDKNMVDIFATDELLYSLDSLGALYKLSTSLDAFTPLSASASNEVGFFNSPMGVAAKNSTVYVADSANDRIAQYKKAASGEKELSYVTDKYISPVSVVCDNRGSLYVGHDVNCVSINEKEAFRVGGSIVSLAVNADKKVFILSTDGVYEYDTELKKVTNDAYSSIALGVGKETCFGLKYDGSVVTLFDSDGAYDPQPYCSVASGYFSLAVDYAGNAFMLSNSCVTRYDAESKTYSSYDLQLNGDGYQITAGSIVLSTVDNDFTHYGDAIITDTYKHRLFTASGSETGLKIKLVGDDDDDNQGFINDDAPTYHDYRLIRTALYDAPIFSLPSETANPYIVKTGRKLIVPQYDLEDDKEYSFVLVDDTDKGLLIQGYTYKDALSEPLPYAPPPKSSISTFINGTPIYKWPSPHSVNLAGYSPVNSGSDFTAVDFVEDYRDYKNNLWYRVKVDENFEGYMMASNVNLGDYETTLIRPAYNAKIIADGNDDNAQAYLLKDGNFVPIDIVIDVGTEVEVVGSFDTSEPYTQIKHLTENGTVTCYVKTGHVKYNGVNVVILVAIVVIVITAILAIVIVARVITLKKRRLTSDGVDDDKNLK